MAAQLLPHEILAQEVQKLEERKTALASQVKSYTMMIKDLQEQLVLAKIESRQTIQEVQETCEARCAELRQLTAPYEALKEAYGSLTQQVEALKREKAEAVGAIKVATGTALQEKHRQLAAVNAQLSTMESAIAACKMKVASL